MGTKESVVSVVEEQREDIFILHMKGRLDALSSPGAESKVFDHIHQGHCKLLIDLKEVNYLSSAGLRMLLSVSKKAKTLPGRVVVCALTQNVKDTMRLSGFESFLESYPSEEEALKHFQPSA